MNGYMILYDTYMGHQTGTYDFYEVETPYQAILAHVRERDSRDLISKAFEAFEFESIDRIIEFANMFLRDNDKIKKIVQVKEVEG